ncbi:MAG TPA: serine/threonine-protein kinase [Kofleriaceae bacterium]|jgi:serine/threonine-protein kinase|nr:serine/threonine-protein kinase [Kofleriaceae bacterium]
MPATRDPVLKQGDVLEGKYVLRDRIGEGGMGSVFLADQPALERTVAIKVLHPELVACPAQIRRIREEAIAASHVRNPHCVGVIDCSVLPDGAPYIVMQHVPGRPLGRIIAEEPIPLARAVELVLQILNALGATHDSGIIHADVKSDNFLVEVTRDGDHVTLIDFGLARFEGSPACVDLEDGKVMVSGTPEYMAPEVVRGAPPIRASDLYGVGVILYEILTGTTPFGGGTTMEIMLRHARDIVVPPSLRRPDRDIPLALDQVVLRALAKRPDARFPDAATFAQALRLAASTSQPSPSTPVRREDHSRTESPTRDLGTALPRRGIARGSDHSSADRGRRRKEHRFEIGEALARGNVRGDVA